MKRILSIILAFTLIISNVSFTFAVDCQIFSSETNKLIFQYFEDVTTSIVDIYGNETVYSGALDVDSLESYDFIETIASYVILFDGEELLSVSLHDILTEEEYESSEAGILCFDTFRFRFGYQCWRRTKMLS